jgi:hypothetical protein
MYVGRGRRLAAGSGCEVTVAACREHAGADNLCTPRAAARQTAPAARAARDARRPHGTGANKKQVGARAVLGAGGSVRDLRPSRA